MCCNKQQKIIKILKEKRVLGIKILKNPSKWKPKVKTQGWRYHMSNIMAAIGIIQFKKKINLKLLGRI